MKFDRHKHRRRSIRLPGCDYSHPRAYFVTLCTFDRECLFGDVIGGGVRLNEWGRFAREEWLRSAGVRPGVVLDAFVIMPNHMHGIIILTPESQSVGPRVGAHAVGAHAVGAHAVRAHSCAPLHRPPRSLASFVACYKASVTRRINESRGTPGARLWQRNYYERVIRDDEELGRALGYIADNPARWAADDYFPGS